MSPVVVEFDSSLTDAELRQLICDLWVIQAAPVLAKLKGVDSFEVACNCAETKGLCQRLVDFGIISLIWPEQTVGTDGFLFSGSEVYAVATDAWEQCEQGWVSTVELEAFIPIHEQAKERAAQVLRDHPV